MSDVTFTPEQVNEIRRRIEAHCREQGYSQWVTDAILAAFPLSKVTRFRTFTMTWDDLPESKVETYRVNGQVEYLSADGRWYQTNYGTGSIRSFAEELAAKCRWKALAALADVAARPTEEVDA